MSLSVLLPWSNSRGDLGLVLADEKSQETVRTEESNLGVTVQGATVIQFIVRGIRHLVNHCECQGFPVRGSQAVVSETGQEGAARCSRSQKENLLLDSRIMLSQAVHLEKHPLVSAHLYYFGVHFLFLKLSPSFHIF